MAARRSPWWQSHDLCAPIAAFSEYGGDQMKKWLYFIWLFKRPLNGRHPVGQTHPLTFRIAMGVFGDNLR